jgi:hypothetical protein
VAEGESSAARDWLRIPCSELSGVPLVQTGYTGDSVDQQHRCQSAHVQAHQEVRRFTAQGRAGLQEQSRAPHRCPHPMLAADFKGQFHTGDGLDCYPLTVADAYRRFLFSCSARLSTKQVEACPIFERLFAVVPPQAGLVLPHASQA